MPSLVSSLQPARSLMGLSRRAGRLVPGLSLIAPATRSVRHFALFEVHSESELDLAVPDVVTRWDTSGMPTAGGDDLRLLLSSKKIPSEWESHFLFLPRHRQQQRGGHSLLVNIHGAWTLIPLVGDERVTFATVVLSCRTLAP